MRVIRAAKARRSAAKSRKTRVLYQGRFSRFLERNDWEFVERTNCTGIVIIISMTGKKEVLFTEQFRPPVARRVIEFPAGLANDIFSKKRETIEDAALRELEEETGYRAKKVSLLLYGPVNSGLSTDLVRFYRAWDLKKVSEGGGDEYESITVHRIPLKKVPAWLKKMERAGKLVDPKIYAGLYFLNQKT